MVKCSGYHLVSKPQFCQSGHSTFQTFVLSTIEIHISVHFKIHIDIKYGIKRLWLHLKQLCTQCMQNYQQSI